MLSFKSKKSNIINDYTMTSNELRITWCLSIIFSLRILGVFMLLPVLPTYGLSLKGANETLIGLSIGIYGFMQAIFQIPMGILSDKINCKILIIYGLIIFSLGSFIPIISHSIWSLILGRALQGSGTVTSVIMTILSSSIREQNRTKAIACIGINFGIAFAIAIIVGPLIASKFSLNLLFWIITILGVISIIFTILMVPKNKNYQLNNESKILKKYFIEILINPSLLKINFSIMCLHALLVSTFITLSQQLKRINLPISNYWKIYLITMLVSFILVIPYIIYAEKKHYIKQTFLISILLLLCSEVIRSLFNFSKIGLLIGIQLFFLSFNAMEAILPSMISKISPAGYKGTAMGIYSTSQFIGLAMGGMITGFIKHYFNLETILIFNIVLTITWLLIAFTMKNPLYLTSLVIKIPNGIKINNSLEQYFKSKDGIKEVFIQKQEKYVYIKINNKKTSRSQIEKELKSLNYLN